jgi:hypothetical protein
MITIDSLIKKLEFEEDHPINSKLVLEWLKIIKSQRVAFYNSQLGRFIQTHFPDFYSQAVKRRRTVEEIAIQLIFDLMDITIANKE